MEKIENLIAEKLNLIDVVYEVIDARMPYSSKIVDIEDLIKDKPRILVMTKFDLCDEDETQKFVKYYEEQGYKVVTVDLMSNNNNGVKKITPATFVLWALVCVIVNFFAFAPRFSDPLAGFFGFGRGLDLLLVLGYGLLVYAIFRLYVKIDELNRNTTELVRALAIKDEIKLEDIDKEEE